LENLQFVCDRYPDDPTYLDAKNAILTTLSGSYLLSDPARSEKLALEVIAETEELVAKYPNAPLYGKYLYKSFQVLGNLASNALKAKYLGLGGFSKGNPYIYGRRETDSKMSAFKWRIPTNGTQSTLYKVDHGSSVCAPR